MNNNNQHVIKAYGISVFFEHLLYFLTIGLIFETTWEVILEKTPLNMWISIAYLLPPIYMAFSKMDDFKKTDFNPKKEMPKIKEKMEKIQKKLWLIVGFGLVFYFFKISLIV